MTILAIFVRTLIALIIFFVRTKIRLMSDEDKKPGRPPKAKKASARCEFRVEPKRKDHYDAHAEKQGLKTSAWLKKLADEDSGWQDD